MNLWSVVAWFVVAVLGAITGSVALGRTGHVAFAVAQDALTHLLWLAWIVTAVAFATGRWWLAGAGTVLVAFHLFLLVPRLIPTRMPAWTRRAPRLRLAVCNVFIDNETPGELAQLLVGTAADAIVIAEWNPAFVTAFDAAGGADAYPHRLFDPDDDSDYAVAFLSATALGPSSGMIRDGPLGAAQAVLDVAGTQLTVIALNPMAAVDPEGYPTWERQVDALHDHIRTVPGPLVVAGDLNTTTVRPAVRRLLALGLLDAHESLGKGMSASFKLSADGPLAAPGAVVRLDHVLTNEAVRAVSTEDLPSAGSDHLPFIVELAVRPTRHGLRPRRSSRRFEPPVGEREHAEQPVGHEADPDDRHQSVPPPERGDPT